MQKQWTSDVACLLGRFFNNAKPANWRKETAEIAEIVQHNKQNDDQHNTEITKVQIT